LAESAGKEDPKLNGVQSISLVESQQALWVAAGKTTWNGGPYGLYRAYGNPVVSLRTTVTRGKVSVFRALHALTLKVRANPARKGARMRSAHSANHPGTVKFTLERKCSRGWSVQSG
jgi:hypothetical protein